MIAFATVGRFCDEVMIVSIGTTRAEALAIADKFHTDRRGDWDADADREKWLDSLEILELRGDRITVLRFVSINGSEVTYATEYAPSLNPHTKQEP